MQLAICSGRFPPTDYIRIFAYHVQPGGTDDELDRSEKPLQVHLAE
jgi:hypothetical protein